MDKTLIEKLEKERGSRVLVYITSSRVANNLPIFQAQVAGDVLPFFREMLESFPEENKKITLVLDTLGGNLEAPWPLVNLIREYCETFEVIVLEKAMSAGTLIALGADKIVMLPHSHLSPVDPAREVVDSEKKERKRMEIEDIIGYVDFLKGKVGLKDQSAIAELVRELTKEVSPTLLGSANRTHSLIRSLAEKLLSLHKEPLGKKEVKKIVDHLTSTLYAHNHRINRREAREYVGFGESVIEYADKETKSIISDLEEHYIDLLEINKEFNPEALLGADDSKNMEANRAVVHSADIGYNFVGTYKLIKMPAQAGAFNINVNNYKNVWKKI